MSATDTQDTTTPEETPKEVEHHFTDGEQFIPELDMQEAGAIVATKARDLLKRYGDLISKEVIGKIGGMEYERGCIEYKDRRLRGEKNDDKFEGKIRIYGSDSFKEAMIKHDLVRADDFQKVQDHCWLVEVAGVLLSAEDRFYQFYKPGKKPSNETAIFGGVIVKDIFRIEGDGGSKRLWGKEGSRKLWQNPEYNWDLSLRAEKVRERATEVLGINVNE